MAGQRARFTSPEGRSRIARPL